MAKMYQAQAKGIRLIKVLTGLTATGGFCAYVLPNTLLVNKFKDVTQSY